MEEKQNLKNKYGQYFTPSDVAEFMVDLADVTEGSKILEPSCGQGVFIDILCKRGLTNITAYEIDHHLSLQFPFVRHESFVSACVDEQFDLVIGNPPYVRWKNLDEELKEELRCQALWSMYCNALCDYFYVFILKSIELLKEGGQLIFICPEYWMTTTHSQRLRNYMVQNGYFEVIYHFNETPVFDGVASSLVVFKFIKNKNAVRGRIRVVKFHARKKLTSCMLRSLHDGTSENDTEYLSVPAFKINERWVLQSDNVRTRLRNFEFKCLINGDFISVDDTSHYVTIGDICDIGNGMVSGLDVAFRIDGKCSFLTSEEKKATIKVVKAKDLDQYCAIKETLYIFIKDDLSEEQFEKLYPNFFAWLQPYKTQLQGRYQYNKIIDYWKWVFLEKL